MFDKVFIVSKIDREPIWTQNLLLVQSQKGKIGKVLEISEQTICRINFTNSIFNI